MSVAKNISFRFCFCFHANWYLTSTKQARRRTPTQTPADLSVTSSPPLFSDCGKLEPRKWERVWTFISRDVSSVSSFVCDVSAPLTLFCLSLRLQCWVHGRRHADRKLQDDWETLFQREVAQEFWLWVWLLHAQQQKHLWTYLRISTSVWGHQWVHVWFCFQIYTRWTKHLLKSFLFFLERNSSSDKKYLFIY